MVLQMVKLQCGYQLVIKIDDPIDPYSGSFSTMLCFIGAQNLNIYGFGNNSIIDANTNVDTSVSQDAVVQVFDQIILI